MNLDRPCGLVFIVPDCKPRGPGFDSRRYKIFCVAMDLQRGHTLVGITEELFE
jgi:hypothetical protein